MTEAQAAHLRLLSILPSRKHERVWVEGKSGGSKSNGSKSNGSPKPILVRGRRYGSFRQAFRDMRISPLTLAKWLREGKAVYE